MGGWVGGWVGLGGSSCLVLDSNSFKRLGNFTRLPQLTENISYTA